MRTNIYTIFILFLSLSTLNAFSWGVDVQVSSGTPEGAVSVVAKANGDLYASVPQTSLNPSYAMTIYRSTDNGSTWRS